MRYRTYVATPFSSVSGWKDVRKVGYDIKSFLEARGCSYVIFMLTDGMRLNLSFKLPDEPIDLGILYSQLTILFPNCDFDSFEKVEERV